MAVLVSLVCKPGSAKPGMTIENGILQLRVRERAIEGAANAACIEALSRALGVSRSFVTLVSGARSRNKRFALDGVTEDEVRARLGV